MNANESKLLDRQADIDVSIIVVSYNEVDYIEKAVKSCLDQNFSGKYEIIIGDDGSDDGTMDIILRLEKEYPDIIRHFVMNRDDGVWRNDVRASNVIRKAMSISKGKYLCKLDSDDYFGDTNKLSSAVDFLESDKNKSYSAVFTDYAMVFPDGTMREQILNAPVCRSVLISGEYVHIGAFVFRREVYDNGFLFERWCSDVGLFYSVCKAGKLKRISGISYCWYQRSNSITHTMAEKETYVGRLVVLQDTMNKGYYKLSTLSRYRGPLNYVFRNRNNIQGTDNLDKWIAYSADKNHDYLGLIINYDSLKLNKKIGFRILLLVAHISSFYFRVIKRLYRDYHRIFSKNT